MHVSPRRTLSLTSHLIVRKLLALVRAHESVQAEYEDVPLVCILLQLPDLQSGLNTGALDTGDYRVSGGVRRSLTASEPLLGVVIVGGEFFDLVFKQRRHRSCKGEVRDTTGLPGKACSQEFERSDAPKRVSVVQERARSGA
jgi:hypothetical protein